MKLIVQQMATYNVWANEQLLTLIHSLPHHLHHQEVPSSFPTLMNTVLHMWDASSIWWQRMRLSEKITRPGEGFSGNMKEAGSGLMEQSMQWQKFAKAAQEHMLTHEFIYMNTKRVQFKQPVFEVILHVCNHDTYHRGQLVNILRQLGIQKIPQTDFIVYCRKK